MKVFNYFLMMESYILIKSVLFHVLAPFEVSLPCSVQNVLKQPWEYYSHIPVIFLIMHLNELKVI